MKPNILISRILNPPFIGQKSQASWMRDEVDLINPISHEVVGESSRVPKMFSGYYSPLKSNETV
jgi:hypothetical protein